MLQGPGVGKSFRFSIAGLATNVREKLWECAFRQLARHQGDFRKMRKSLWIVPVLLLFVAIGAPKAKADTYTYTFVGSAGSFGSLSGTDLTIVDPTGPLSVSSTNLVSLVTQSTDLLWNSTDEGPITEILLEPGSPVAGLNIGSTGFDIASSIPDLTDPAVPGTYSLGGGVGRLTISSTPEPSSVALMLAGVVFLLVMRKRIGQGLPQAS